MAREPRIFVPGEYYHLAARGNNGDTITFDDWDREALVARVERVVTKYCWTLLAYCVMGTHLHLLVTGAEDTLSRGVQELLTGYSVRTNKRYGRIGHLFQYRFLAVQIEDDEHLLEVSRYIVLNPVRAGICGEPGDWRWSSYRASAGLEHAPKFLALDELLPLFGATPADAFAAYRRHVSDGLDPVSDTGTALDLAWPAEPGLAWTPGKPSLGLAHETSRRLPA